ncbi:unnamed protein product, partial [Mesorhabditis spiculigera]
MMSAFQGFFLISYLCLFFFVVIVVEIQGKEYLCRQGVDYGLVDTWTREQGPKNSPCRDLVRDDKDEWHTRMIFGEKIGDDIYYYGCRVPEQNYCHEIVNTQETEDRAGKKLVPGCYAIGTTTVVNDTENCWCETVDGKQIHLISNTHKEVFAEYEKYIAKEVDITNPAARKKIDKKMPDWLPYALGGAAALLLLAAAVTTAVVLNAKKNKKKGKKEDEATSTEEAPPEKSQVSEATEATNEV